MSSFKFPNLFFRKSDYSKYQYRIISLKFDKQFYIKNHAEVQKIAKKNILFDAVRHYMQHGVASGYDPSPEFSTKYYLKLNPDVTEQDLNPFFHYIMYGAAEGRLPKNTSSSKSGIIDRDLSGYELTDATPHHDTQIYDTIKKSFDVKYYMDNNADLKEHCRKNPGFNCILHYIETGYKENRDPNSEFSSKHYLEVNSDVRSADVNPFYHYITSGKHESRTPRLLHERRMSPLPISPRVLFVGHSGHMAGAEIMLKDILEWYGNKTTYNIDVLVLEYGPLSQEYQKYGRVISLDKDNFVDGFASYDFSKAKYDYIYCNSVASAHFYILYKKFYSKPRIPLIIHIHEMKEAIYNFKENLSEISKYANKFIAASRRVKEDLVEHYEIKSESIEVFESFITISANNISDISRCKKLSRAELGVHDDDLLIVGAGTVYPRKGPDTFVKTLEKLAKSMTSARVVGVWIGEGPDFDGLRHWIWQNGNEDSIRFVGFKNNARSLISAADIFFLSSREDPFPLVCLEAAQYAIPIVYFSKCSGIDAFVKDDAGAAISSYDENAAFRTLQYLINNPSLRSEMGLNARNRVIRNNSQSMIMPKIFQCINSSFYIEPTLSVIIPNFNHERFLGERIQSVLNQDFFDMEIIILDDASVDASLDVISHYENDKRISVHRNASGSGSPFLQWKKGLYLSRGALIWIAESDDSCSSNFLEKSLHGFTKNGLSISHCRTVNIDEFGNKNDATLKRYLGSVAGSKFEEDHLNSGFQEVEQCMSVSCTIVNASGVVVRKTALEKSIPLSDHFKMCGDWIVYLSMLNMGSIYYTTECTNYFRRHVTSVVSKFEGTDAYFTERAKIACYIADNFPVSDRAINQMTINLEREWDRFSHIDKTMSRFELFGFLDRVDRKTPSSRTRHVIGLYIHGLMFSKGGIESQGVALANHFYRSGHDVVVFCRHDISNKPVYPLDHGIIISDVFDEYNISSSCNSLRDDLVKYGVEVFVVMLSEWLFEPIISATHGLRIKVIASEHNDPWIIQDKWWTRERRETTFKSVDYIHILLPEYKKSIPYIQDDRIRIIPNGAKLLSALPAARTGTNHKIIAVGRLAPQKNFASLIRAFAQVAEIHKSWELHIFGEGSDRIDLEKLVGSLRLNTKVSLRGNSDDIYREMLCSDFIVIPSLFEGYPVVAVEAKISGLPIVAYEACNGMRDIVRDGIDGILCKIAPHDDLEGNVLAEALSMLMTSKTTITEMSMKALSNSSQYSIDSILPLWDNFINEVMSS